MKKLRLGVMGTASIAKRLVVPAIKSLREEYDLVAVASRSADKAKEFAGLFEIELAIEGYENLVDRDDIDVIYMPLPTGLHHEWIRKCLVSGKHVLSEKSLATDVESANKLVELAQKHNLLLMENFMFQYHSQHNFVWKLLYENQIGEMRLFRAQFGFPPLDKANFRYDAGLGGGALLDAGAYTVKASRWFLKTPLMVNTATMYVDKQTGVDIYGNATLSTSLGATAQVSYGFDNFYQCNYELWGSKGRILAERAFTPKPDEMPVIVFEQQGSVQRNKMPSDNHFVNILRSFYQSVQAKQYEVHWQEILDQSRVVTEIKKVASKVTI